MATGRVPVERVAAVLGEAELLAAVGEADRVRLAGESVVRRYRRGQPVFAQGDPAEWLAVVLEGRLKVFLHSPDGAEMLLAVLGPGEMLGELGALDGEPRAASLEALESSALICVPRVAVLRLLAERPELSRALLAFMAGMIRRLSGDAADLVFLDLPRRVAKVLVERLARAGTGLTQSQIAAMVGGSRQSVNVALKGFERRGWVQMSPAGVLLTDGVALARFAGS